MSIQSSNISQLLIKCFEILNLQEFPNELSHVGWVKLVWKIFQKQRRKETWKPTNEWINGKFNFVYEKSFDTRRTHDDDDDDVGEKIKQILINFNYIRIRGTARILISIILFKLMFLFAEMLDSAGKILIVFAFWLVNYAVVCAHPPFISRDADTCKWKCQLRAGVWKNNHKYFKIKYNL